MTSSPLLIILGATASGKTKLAIELAKILDTEIISADSRQVFKDMDIGTGKDLAEFREAKIPFHLIDIRVAGQSYNVNSFKEDFYNAFKVITTKNKLPILCGGTGMYIHSLLQNHEFTAVPTNEKLRLSISGFSKEQLSAKIKSYPANLISHVDFSSSKRLLRAIEVADYLQHHTLEKVEQPSLNPLVIGLVDDLETRRAKISNRLAARLEEGLIDEVEKLIANGVSIEMLTFYGLEYKFVASYLLQEIDYTTLKERLTIAICQFAKRQMTFFRKMEKDGVKINWLGADKEMFSLTEEALRLIKHKFQLK
ncbi:tRNA (adenosine(37)-N6)-dimethylallyltransferase MiaA [Pedobacter sp. Du54]|uniref:tRNA (adenosine(37)-N6)-dimethylallyltransferase MiaA n=1 Tax=Pedobacter anseongensis TaxID=3133439 RepID=UPI0030AB4D64